MSGVNRLLSSNNSFALRWPETTMRRSAHVFAPLLASAALALATGCNSADPQRCVDEQNHVVDPKFCANLPPGAISSGTSRNGGGYFGGNGLFYPHLYRNYYGGSFLPGGIVSGGSYTPLAGHSYSFSSGTSRGGFGSSFSESGG
jgi:hypothetical protein